MRRKKKSTGMLYFFENIALLNITRTKTLYFTRRINLMRDPENPMKEYEQLSLDILRYFDYFQSQWRLPSPTRIFVSSEIKDIAILAKNLSEFLSLTVEPYSLAPIFAGQPNKPLLEKKYLLALGAALRQENIDAQSRN